MRVLIFGHAGSGRSSLAGALAEPYRLVDLDPDSIVWEPAPVAVQRSAAAIIASMEVCMTRHDESVIEGCHGELAKTATADCSELVFPDTGLEVCLAGTTRRPWEPHNMLRARSRMPGWKPCRHGSSKTAGATMRSLAAGITAASTRMRERKSSTLPCLRLTGS